MGDEHEIYSMSFSGDEHVNFHWLMGSRCFADEWWDASSMMAFGRSWLHLPRDNPIAGCALTLLVAHQLPCWVQHLHFKGMYFVEHILKHRLSFLHQELPANSKELAAWGACYSVLESWWTISILPCPQLTLSHWGIMRTIPITKPIEVDTTTIQGQLYPNRIPNDKARILLNRSNIPNISYFFYVFVSWGSSKSDTFFCDYMTAFRESEESAHALPQE